MEFQDVVRKRRMVRAFDDRPIPPETVEHILGNAQRGPSSGFTQGFEFLVFNGHEQTERFWDATPWPGTFLAGARRAPLLVIPLTHQQAYVDRYRSPDKAAVGRQTAEDFPAPYWFIDAGFAVMLILLTAVDAGLGAFYFSLGPTSREIPAFRAAFGVPEAYYPIGAIAIGYPGPGDPSPRPEEIRRRRRDPQSRMHIGRW